MKINKTICRNEAGAYVISNTTKTDSGNRTIPLNDDVLDIIKNQENQNKTFFGAPENSNNISEAKNNLLFRSVEGKVLREYSLNREISRICKQAGIEHFTCHAFRNTFITDAIEQHAEEYKAISAYVGHKHTAITLDLYTHVRPSRMNKVVKDIGLDKIDR